MTGFLAEHPGGSSIILKYAGRDATSVYQPIHPSDALDKNLSPSQHLGPVNDDAANVLAKEETSKKKTKDELRVEQAMKQRPPLNRILNLNDMQASISVSLYTSSTDKHSRKLLSRSFPTRHGLITGIVLSILDLDSSQFHLLPAQLPRMRLVSDQTTNSSIYTVSMLSIQLAKKTLARSTGFSSSLV